MASTPPTAPTERGFSIESLTSGISSLFKTGLSNIQTAVQNIGLPSLSKQREETTNANPEKVETHNVNNLSAANGTPEDAQSTRSFFGSFGSVSTIWDRAISFFKKDTQDLPTNTAPKPEMAASEPPKAEPAPEHASSKTAEPELNEDLKKDLNKLAIRGDERDAALNKAPKEFANVRQQHRLYEQNPTPENKKAVEDAAAALKEKLNAPAKASPLAAAKAKETADPDSLVAKRADELRQAQSTQALEAQRVAETGAGTGRLEENIKTVKNKEKALEEALNRWKRPLILEKPISINR